ncbi:MAG: hypothetical protein E2P03_12040 [Acidobacteria bacterium]|nr:MAG: hypothetical protein E2P03_12040 [Acidobacteriota bacterium]
MRLESGRRLGPYEIGRPLGAGGMGEVYEARDTRLGRTVAVKVLPEHLSGDLKLRQRVEREARAVSSLNHPHICTLHDIISVDPQFRDAVAGDYRLSGSSPALDAAAVLSVFPVDEDGVRFPRPVDGSLNGVVLPDMGAFEDRGKVGDLACGRGSAEPVLGAA